MWEYCLTLDTTKSEMLNSVWNKLICYSKEYEIVLTKMDSFGMTNILIACNSFERYRLISFLQEIICECICYYYKKEFLLSKLKLKTSDKIMEQAFISALLFFDKDTDKFIVNKYLNIDKKINVGGFFNFKLQTIKDKWDELIEIANDNEVYLYSNETFIELIKFLIDNIEIKNEVINIIPKQDKYEFCDSKFDAVITKEVTEEKLLDNLIELCPKNINIYGTEKVPEHIKDVISKLFEKRVKFLTELC